MSFSQQVSSSINAVIYKYLETVASTYTIPLNDLVKLWGTDSIKSAHSEAKSLEKSDSPALNEADGRKAQLLKKSKDELVQMCKEMELRWVGTKSVLVDRIINGNVVPVKEKPKQADGPKPVIKSQLTDQRNKIKFVRSRFGNHAFEGLVLNTSTELVIGFEQEDGSIRDLTPEDIDLCNKYKLLYEMPENLDAKQDLGEVQIDEMESEEDDDYEEIIEEALLANEEGELEEDEEFEEEFEEFEEYEDNDFEDE